MSDPLRDDEGDLEPDPFGDFEDEVIRMIAELWDASPWGRLMTFIDQLPQLPCKVCAFVHKAVASRL